MGFCTNIWLIFFQEEENYMPKHFGKKINDRKKGKENKEKKKQNYIQQQQGHTCSGDYQAKTRWPNSSTVLFFTKYRTLIFLTFSVIHFNKITTNTLPEIKT